MKKSKYSDSQIMAILKQAEAGTPVPQLSRSGRIVDTTYFLPDWADRALKCHDFQKNEEKLY